MNHRRWSGAVAALLCGLYSCDLGHVPIEGAACPCPDSFVCCEADATCAQEIAECAPALTGIDPVVMPLRARAEVTLSGQALGAGDTAPQVTIGGRSCEVQRFDANSIVCTAPEGAPTVSDSLDVVVTMPDARSTTLPGAFRYILDAFFELTRDAGLNPALGGDAVSLLDVDADGRLDIHMSWEESSYPQRNRTDPFRNAGGFQFVQGGEPVWPTLSAHEGLLAGNFLGDAGVDLVVLEGSPEGGWGNAALLRHYIGSAGGFDAASDPALRVELTQSLHAAPITLAPQAGSDQLGVIGCGAESDLYGAGEPFVLQAEGALLSPLQGASFEVDLELHPGGQLPRCHAVALGDFDQDGDADVAFCGSAVVLFRREGTRFVDATDRIDFGDRPAAGTRCRSLSWDDIDADGDLDLSVFTRGSGNDGRSGTTVLQNNEGQGQRRLVAVDFEVEPGDDDAGCPDAYAVDGAALPGGVEGGAWVDADNDGDLDLLLPFPFQSCSQGPILYENRLRPSGAMRFVPRRIESYLVPFETELGLATGDLDGDGDIDFIVNASPPYRSALLRNNLIENRGTGQPASGFLEVRALTGPGGDAAELEDAALWDALGIRIEVGATADFAIGAGEYGVRMLGGMLEDSQQSPRAHLGVGDAAGPFWVRAYFPTSTVTHCVPSADRTVVLRDCADAACCDAGECGDATCPLP